jgi:hypothetical protein
MGEPQYESPRLLERQIRKPNLLNAKTHTETFPGTRANARARRLESPRECQEIVEEYILKH